MTTNNSTKIIKFFVLLGLFSFASMKMKEIVLDKIEQNGFNEISNRFFSFYEVHNTGAAFNMFTDKSNELIIAAVVFIIICLAVVLAKTSKLNQTIVSSMSLLSAGILTNTIERIQTGYVTDYMYFTFFKNFPVFNLSDVMIVIGAFMLTFSLTTSKQAEHD